MSLYRFGRLVCRIFFKTVFRFQAEGVANVPSDGPVILCSNHISTFDPPTVGIALERKVHFMAKAELFDIPLFGTLIRKLGAFPVKRGGVSKESIRYALQLLGEGGMMGIFPEGTRGGGGMGKKGAASLALRSGAAVVPVAIIGRYKPFRKMKVVYGKPIDLAAYRDSANSDSLEQATEHIMSTIRELVASHS
ncbi:lysophospholipid acyltransferase family protein [Paenibacillus flagellatus]|uniref:1-acyl-sn-glycerol-3-phosphate acyltransferase n=1 Tax=Paenibacillus flagellatus TaxID=2211139 RepID=A0A2V5K6C5_9BACL|nr:lysophospholipid acyltransferase family protein [Paenibacillus flagellatus]PYI54959.1 1-acyl-sn-glycerol-3-phosphate acyltransferase [Paenibacillus flagellatus]